MSVKIWGVKRLKKHFQFSLHSVKTEKLKTEKLPLPNVPAGFRSGGDVFVLGSSGSLLVAVSGSKKRERRYNKR